MGSVDEVSAFFLSRPAFRCGSGRAASTSRCIYFDVFICVPGSLHLMEYVAVVVERVTAFKFCSFCSSSYIFHRLLVEILSFDVFDFMK